MKKFINQIGRLMLIVIICLMYCFVICKNLILLDLHKISKLEFEHNICDALYDSTCKAYTVDLINFNELDDLFTIISEIKVNVLDL